MGTLLLHQAVGSCRGQLWAQATLDMSRENGAHTFVLSSFPEAMGHQDHGAFQMTKPREAQGHKARDRGRCESFRQKAAPFHFSPDQVSFGRNVGPEDPGTHVL